MEDVLDNNMIGTIF